MTVSTALSALPAGGQARPQFEAAVAHSFDEAPITPREWDDFVLSVHGDLYMSFDWCRIWWRHYGLGRALRLFVFRESGRVVGLAPMFVERVWLGPVGLKMGKRVGADYALSIFSLPIAPDFIESVYAHVLSSLIGGKDRCDVVWIGCCPADDPTFPGMRAAARGLDSLAIIVHDAVVGCHTRFDLPATFDAYLAKLSKHQRQNYRRQLKLLQNEFTVENEVVTEPPHAGRSFDQFRAAHALQWTAGGDFGHFGDWPRAGEFNSELVDCLSRIGRFRLVRLIANGEVVSDQYAFVFGQSCYWRLPARSPRAEFDKFGLGVLGLVQLIEVMIRERVRSIEAGVGRYEYKIRFGGKESDVLSCLIAANRVSSITRSKLFILSSRALHFVYYKIWFCRISKYFPGLRRPLWRIWIRSRL